MKQLLILSFIIISSLLSPLKSFAKSSETNYIKTIEELIILDSGRYKPFDSYARNKLLQFSGRTSVKFNNAKLTASEWLSLSIFEPEKAKSIKIFLINNPQIAQSLNIEDEEKRRYSYAKLRDKVDLINEFAAKAFTKDEKKRDLLDKEFIRVFTNFHNYSELINSFSLFQTKNSLKFFSQAKISKKLNISKNPTIYELSQKAPLLEDLINSNNKELKDQAIKLGFTLYSWIESYRDYRKTSESENLAFINNDSGSYNPWTYFFKLQEKNSEFKAETLKKVAELQLSYENHDSEKFSKLIKEFNKNSDKQSNISLELLFNKVQPFK